jgi:hypothetical protein
MCLLGHNYGGGPWGTAGSTLPVAIVQNIVSTHDIIKIYSLTGVFSIHDVAGVHVATLGRCRDPWLVCRIAS